VRRDIHQKLTSWQQSKGRKPLVLQGARQVGKSHALRWLGESQYDEAVTLNFERDPLLASLFADSLDPKVLVRNISSYFGKTIYPQKTLIIFDEIQECNAALNALKYFCEEAPEYHVAAAGSLLGVMLSSGRSFPVGKVDFLNIYPMTFCEFLDATGNQKLREMLDDKKDLAKLPQAFHQKLLGHLTQYFIVGGMPEVVGSYIENVTLKKHGAFKTRFSHRTTGISRNTRLRVTSLSSPLFGTQFRIIWHEKINVLFFPAYALVPEAANSIRRFNGSMTQV
jgi:predicted AAA+ superfamily ATPase